MISERLKELRIRQGLTQVELARKIGITKDLYNKYERTDIRPPYETICKLADVLSTTTDYILERTDNSIPISGESNKTNYTDVHQNIISDNNKANSPLSRINSMRLKSGLSREELAKKAGVSIDVIANLEEGKGGINGDNVDRVAKALNTNFDYLMGFSDDSTPPQKSMLAQLADNPPEAQPVAYIFGSNGGRKVITDKNKIDAINAFVELLDKNESEQK